MDKDVKKTHEVDLIALAQKVLEEKRLMAKFVLVAAIIGVIVAMGRTKAYTAEVILAPEMSSGGLGMADNLMDMAASFGFDIGTKSSIDAIYPEIYPTLMSSNDFIIQLLDVPVTLKESETTKTFMNHLLTDNSIPFWSYPMIWIKSLFKKKEESAGKGKIDPFRLTKNEEGLIERIRGAISCVVDKKTSIITIKVTDNDAQVAAIMADTLQQRLQKYITDYRTKKARTDVEYYARLFKESKKNYDEAREHYTSFADSNAKTVLQSYIAKQEELENEMELKQKLYSQIATQLQSAQAKVQERTPAFTIIQSSTVPNLSSSTPRSYTVLAFIVMGIGLDALWVLFGRQFMQNRRGARRQGTGS